MPVINSFIPMGTMLKFIEPVDDYSPVEDTTVGKVYEVVGRDYDGDIYYFDDIGEKNYSASPGGDGNFEIVEGV